MPEPNERDDDIADDEPQEEDPSKVIRALRKQVREAEGVKAEYASAQRELAFLRAGIDTTTKLGAYFAKSYDGPLDDPDAIRAEATEIGLLKSPEGEAEAETDDTDTAQTAERRALASGAVPDTGEGVDPRKVAYDSANEKLAKGATFEDAAGGFIRELANAAKNGDNRVLAPSGTYQ